MKRPWLYYFSPFILAAIATLIPIGKGLAEINKHESFGVIQVFMNVALLLFLLGVDHLIKNLTNGKILYFWIIEALLLAIVLVLVYNTSGFRI
jgi:hypothetical protein